MLTIRVCRSLLKLTDTLISPGPRKYIQNIDKIEYQTTGNIRIENFAAKCVNEVQNCRKTQYLVVADLPMMQESFHLSLKINKARLILDLIFQKLYINTC